MRKHSISIVLALSVFFMIALQGRVEAQEIIEAAGKGDLQRLNQLLSEGKKVDVKSPQGITPLMAAAFHGRTEAVKVLLEHKARVDEKDGTGETIASQINQEENGNNESGSQGTYRCGGTPSKSGSRPGSRSEQGNYVSHGSLVQGLRSRRGITLEKGRQSRKDRQGRRDLVVEGRGNE